MNKRCDMALQAVRKIPNAERVSSILTALDCSFHASNVEDIGKPLFFRTSDSKQIESQMFSIYDKIKRKTITRKDTKT